MPRFLLCLGALLIALALFPTSVRGDDDGGGTHSQSVWMCGPWFDTKVGDSSTGSCVSFPLPLPHEGQIKFHLNNGTEIAANCRPKYGESKEWECSVDAGTVCGASKRFRSLQGQAVDGGFDFSRTSVATPFCALRVDTNAGHANNGAIGKCYDWFSYEATPQDAECQSPNQAQCETKHRAEFETCLRMVRADYCGCGISETLQGVRIEAYRPGETPACALLPKRWGCFEGSWNEEGVVCISHKRVRVVKAAIAESLAKNSGSLAATCLARCQQDLKDIPEVKFPEISCRSGQDAGSAVLRNRSAYHDALAHGAFIERSCSADAQDAGPYDPDCR